MPAINVSPTRMELTRLKARLKTAVRGHKLLKDKRDELMKQFLDVAREGRILRVRVEEGLQAAHGSFTVAAALMSGEVLEQSLLYPKEQVSLELEVRSAMGIDLPQYRFRTGTGGAGDIYPYGFAATSGELDDALDALHAILPDLLHLAQLEKSAQLLAGEIERTRRRVNALEYVKIPQMTEAIKYISMKLDENERAATIRLMKVKDMILAEAMEEKKAENLRATMAFASANDGVFGV